MKFIPEISEGRNALIEGENIDIMNSLLGKGFDNRFHMIYFDGPFNSGLLFSSQQPKFGFEYIYPWSQYDTVQNYFHLPHYLEHYRQRIERARELLREDGIFVLQTNMVCGHHIKVLLDGIFGRENFHSEVIWKHSQAPWPSLWGFPVGYQHETLFFYSKSAKFLERLDRSSNFPSVWDDISGYQYSAEEETHYPSQKPEKLLERLLDVTTKEGDWVGDFYCGSGTMAYTAEKKNRRWLACDNNPISIQVTNNRLAKIGASFGTHKTEDTFKQDDFQDHAYIKKTRTPVSAGELKELQHLKSPVEVSAFHYLPEIDMLNEKGQFVFHYLFPAITRDGISETETVRIARPIPVKDQDGFRLAVANEFDWMMHHMVLMDKNYLNMLDVTPYDKDYAHIFKWDQAVSKALELLETIKGNWIASAVEQDGRIAITDLFGYSYTMPANKLEAGGLSHDIGNT